MAVFLKITNIETNEQLTAELSSYRIFPIGDGLDGGEATLFVEDDCFAFFSKKHAPGDIWECIAVAWDCGNSGELAPEQLERQSFTFELSK